MFPIYLYPRFNSRLLSDSWQFLYFKPVCGRVDHGQAHEVNTQAIFTFNSLSAMDGHDHPLKN